MSHVAHSSVVCRLRNDDLFTTLVDVHNLNSFGCHRLTKEIRGKKVPPGIPKICMHKFRKGPVKLAKQIGT